MLEQMKLGFQLVKYGFRPKTNLVSVIVILLIGLVTEFVTKGTNLLGGFYLILCGMFIFQMLLSLDLSALIQTSAMKKLLQTKIPVFTSSAIYLAVFTLLVVERAILQRIYPELGPDLCNSLFMISVMLFGAMLYTGFVYKYFVVGTIVFMVLFIGGNIGLQLMIEFSDNFSISLPVAALVGYALILLGTALEYAFVNLLYKKDLSKYAFKGLLSKM